MTHSISVWGSLSFPCVDHVLFCYGFEIMGGVKEGFLGLFMVVNMYLVGAFSLTVQSVNIGIASYSITVSCFSCVYCLFSRVQVFVRLAPGVITEYLASCITRL